MIISLDDEINYRNYKIIVDSIESLCYIVYRLNRKELKMTDAEIEKLLEEYNPLTPIE